MTQDNQNDLLEKKKLLKYGIGAFAVIIVVAISFRAIGLLDWSTIGRDIVVSALGDVATCLYWWYCRD